MEDKILSPLLSAIVRYMPHTYKELSEKSLYRYIEKILQKKSFFLESAARFKTPLYFYDETAFINRINDFKDIFKRHFDHFQMFYAMKSNSHPYLSLKAVENGAGLDVSSGMELSRALSTDCESIIFSGPGKTDEELDLAIKNRDRVTIMLDSYGELNRLISLLKIAPPGHSPVKTGIRIRNLYQKNWNKFGVPLIDLGLLLGRIASEGDIVASGIQFHTSWNMNPRRQTEMIEAIGQYIRKQTPADSLRNFKFIDVGGGYWPEKGEWLNPENTSYGRLLKLLFPSAGFENRHYYIPAKPLNNFARVISRVISIQPAPIPDLEVWTEPGRWISTPAMHILLRVIDIKDSKTVITDGGINLLGWERPLTEFIPVINLTRPLKKESDIAVFGSLCAPDDVWGRSIFGNGIEEGDILIIPDQGAYTYSLRQEFIKPVASVIKYNGNSLEEIM